MAYSNLHASAKTKGGNMQGLTIGGQGITSANRQYVTEHDSIM